jgi:cytosine/adenosine deaminase-related metal-dependent hydrolase
LFLSASSFFLFPFNPAILQFCNPAILLMQLFTADWVLPISAPPVHGGWIAVEGGRIAARGTASESPLPPGPCEHLGHVALMPGLANAHTHLELSYLRDEVPPGASFVEWIRAVMAARRRQPDPRAAIIMEGVEAGIGEAVASGTALVGDISNTLVTFEPLARSPLGGVVFYELIRFNIEDPSSLIDEACRRLDGLPAGGRVRSALAAHAPYSVAPSLFRAIRRAADRDPLAPYSVHLAESAEEVRFVERADGPWRAVLEELGTWSPSWSAPGVSPVHYLDDAGFLGPRTLAVHGVQMSMDDLGRLAARGTTLVACPRSNGHTGAGAPPLEDFYESGVQVAIGTDSLASAPDLNLFAELATMRALSPSIPASRLLDSATRVGARALGFETDYGTLDSGKKAPILAVQVPPGLDDVEEYLVSGIQPEQVRWIAGESAGARRREHP